MTRRSIVRAVQIIFFLALLIFVGVYLRDQLAQLRDNPLAINWTMLIFAQIGMTIGLGLLPLGSLLILRDLEENQRPFVIWRAFFISNIAKYLPGSIWALPGRMFLYQRAGVPTAKSVIAVFWEVLLMVTGAGITALLSLRLVTHYLPSGLVFSVIFGGIVLVVIGVLSLRSEKFINWLKSQKLPSILRRLLDRPDLWLSLPQILMVIFVYIVAWVVIGLSFAGIVYAIAPELSAGAVLEIIGLYAGTWMIGFLIIFTPGGIGVRDVLIALGLAVFLNEPIPATAAIIARIGWTLAEIVGVMLTSLFFLYVDLPEAEVSSTQGESA
ncbi:MAG: lysylphosphatidylglycerol synthase domain-containing protein [Aggregatilineales bacterium]